MPAPRLQSPPTANQILVIWDFDGTLAYRLGGLWSAAILEVLAQEEPGAVATLEQVRPFLRSGFPWHKPDQPHPQIRGSQAWWDALDPVLERAFQGLGFGHIQAVRMAKKVRRIYPDPERWRLFDDTLPVLLALTQRGCLQVILSNHVPELPALVEQLGINRNLARIFSSALTGYEKPHPRAFQLVLEAYPQARRAVMIGDSPDADIAGAGYVGVPGILVSQRDAGAQSAAHCLSQVPSLLDAMLADSAPELRPGAGWEDQPGSAGGRVSGIT